MIFDKTLQFSDQQAITATAVSTNVIDLLPTGTVYGHAAALLRDLGIGNKIPLLVQVVQAFNTLTSLTIALQGSTDEAFSSPQTIFTTPAVPLASLVVGYQVPIDFIPRGATYRYLRLSYTVAGSNPSTGKITAGVVAGVQPSGPGPYA